MIAVRNLTDVTAYRGPDGAYVQELGGASTGMQSHSVAVICHPPGTASREHHHTIADEVYVVLSGTGELLMDGQRITVRPNDIVILLPGQRHKIGCSGDDDLVLYVTCSPAYDPGEVIWDE